MGPLRIRGPLRRVGNVFAIFVSRSRAKTAGLHEGQTVEADIRVPTVEPLGLWKGTGHKPFDRRSEGIWRDRL